MTTRPTIALAAAAALSVVATLLVAGPAHAAPPGTCNVRVGPNLAIDAPYEEFRAVLAPDCAASDTEYAAWDVIHERTGFSDILIFDGASQDTWDFYSWEDLGTYKVRPSGAWDSSYDDVKQNTATVSVRRQSAMGFGAVRKGSKVVLSTEARYYNHETDTWPHWRGATVVLQTRATSTQAWRTVAVVPTGSNGRTSNGINAPTGSEFRAVIQSQSSVWGRTSATLKR